MELGHSPCPLNCPLDSTLMFVLVAALSVSPQVLEAYKQGLRPAVGYELNPWLLCLSHYRAWKAGYHGKVSFLKKDLWKVTASQGVAVLRPVLGLGLQPQPGFAGGCLLLPQPLLLSGGGKPSSFPGESQPGQTVAGCWFDRQQCSSGQL